MKGLTHSDRWLPNGGLSITTWAVLLPSNIANTTEFECSRLTFSTLSPRSLTC
jgi:hypothetical protein